MAKTETVQMAAVPQSGPIRIKIKMVNPSVAVSTKTTTSAITKTTTSAATTTTTTATTTTTTDADQAAIGDIIRVFGDDTAALDVAPVTLPQSYIDHLNEVELDIHPPIVVWGRQCRMKRRVRFFSMVNEDGSMASSGYSYSNQTSESHQMDTVMIKLTHMVNSHFGEGYNGILFNRYLNGTEYISAHSDDERGLGTGGVIALVFGQPRVFRIRKRTPGSKTNPIVYDFEPEQYFGDQPFVMRMSGNFQKWYTHEVPERKSLQDKSDPESRQFERTSLTWRNHVV